MKTPPESRLLLARILSAILILLFSVGGTMLLYHLRDQTEAVQPPEPRLSVEIMTARKTSATVTLSGHGVVRPLRTVELTAEVGGTIVDMPRVLRTGDTVSEGETLVQIDPRDTAAALAEAEAGRAQARAARESLLRNQQSDEARRPLLLRAHALAKREYERTRTLFEEQEIGSIQAVEQAEQAVTRAALELALLDQTLALYPARLQEAEAAVTAATARRDLANVRHERTEIRAPFSGRIVHAMAETGQTLQPGQTLLTLADDTVLEVLLSLPAADIRNWLPFRELPENTPSAWFPPLPDLPATLTWSEGRTRLQWTGQVHRLASFDATTRTATLAIRIAADAAHAPEHPLPLTDGMFCHIEIPGRTLEEIYRLPRAAVTYDGNVYLADAEDRLRTLPVEILRIEAEDVILRADFPEDARVIVTRLVAPLEAARLNIRED